MDGQSPSDPEIQDVVGSPAPSLSIPAEVNGHVLQLSRLWAPLGYAILVVALTSIVFAGVVRLGWTNWDDDKYVYENPVVLNGDYPNAALMASNYSFNPLPNLSFTWEWQQVSQQPNFEAKARLFHWDNLWMHVLTTFFVFWLMKMLGLRPLWAFFAALLFGIHPMRVESVAWITERKDVMFGLFFVAAMITYVQYLNTEKRRWLWFTGLLFAFSLLSKLQAVALPLSLLAIDWYRGRNWSWKLIGEKIPFFLGSFIIGLYGVYVMFGEQADAETERHFGWIGEMVLGMYAMTIYVVKSLVPYENSTFYPFPEHLGLQVYLVAAGGLVLGGLAFLLRKRIPELAFGLLFFAVNILLVLQVTDWGTSFTSDRLSYIPYIGLFFGLCSMAQRITAGRKALGAALVAGLGMLCMACGYLSFRYIPAWQNSETLWTNVIQHYPRKFAVSYLNRGQYYRSNRQNDLAMADFETVLEYWPENAMGYLDRGNLYFDEGKNREAISDYSKVISLNAPVDRKGPVKLALTEALRNRGAVYSRLQRYPEAFADLSKAIELNPDDGLAWNNRALTYFTVGNYGKAVLDFSESLRLNPENAAAYDARGVCHMQLQQYQAALDDFNMAIERSPATGTFYANRAYAWMELSDRTAAISDAKMAASLGVNVDASLMAGTH